MENKAENKVAKFIKKSGGMDLPNKRKERTKAGRLPANNIIVRILYAMLACLVLVSIATACAVDDPVIDVIQTTTAPTATASPEPTPEPTPTPVPTPEPFGKPNIYLFILDEYSSFDILSKYYKYDAKIFNDYLDLMGFNIARESYTTDNQTEHSICDLLNLDYISRHYTKSKCYKAISDAKLYSILSDLGYSQFQLSTSSDHFKGTVSLNTDDGQEAFNAIKIGSGGNAADNAITGALSELLKSQEVGSNVDAADLNEWGFYPSEYIRNSSRYREGTKVDKLLKIFDYFEDPSNYTATTPRAIYSYTSATHVPFIFNEYGGILRSSAGRNWRDEDVYLGQYKFVNKHLMAITHTIIQNDPDSIIIIMSDHGIRYHADCTETHKFYINDKDSLRIINAVYIKGQKYDIEGLSAINTMRFILSLYEGLDYPPIEDPVTSDSPKNLTGIIPHHR